MKGKNQEAGFDHNTHAKHFLSILGIRITPKDIEFSTSFYGSNFTIFAKPTNEALNARSNIFPKLSNIPTTQIEAPNNQRSSSPQTLQKSNSPYKWMECLNQFISMLN